MGYHDFFLLESVGHMCAPLQLSCDDGFDGCYPRAYRCDGISHCRNGADENNCKCTVSDVVFCQEHIMSSEKGRGKEREAPTHLIEISEFSHAARVTKNRHNRMVCSREAEVTEKSGAHTFVYNPSARYVTKDPRTLCHELIEHSYHLSLCQCQIAK